MSAVVETAVQEVTSQLKEEKENEALPSPTLLKRSNNKTGYCLIIDNRPPLIKGASILPIKRLRHILKEQFHFITLHLTSLSNLALEQLLTTLKQINQSNSSCLLIITISTSKEGVVNGVDEQSLTTKNIMEYFSDKNCPSLIGKPVVFLFQTVSSDKSDDKIKLTCTQPLAIGEYPFLPLLLKTLRDYSDSATTGSIFVTTSTNSPIATPNNVQLQEAFVLPCTHQQESRLREQHCELILLLKLFLPIRKLIVHLLDENESLIIKTCQDIYANKIVAGTGGVAGTIFTVTGLSLIPVTLGISLILTGVGVGIGAAGGIAALVSTLSDAVSRTSDLKDLKYLTELDYQLCLCVNECVSESGIQLNTDYDYPSCSEVAENIDLIDIVTKAYKQLNSKDKPAIAWLKQLTSQRKKELENIENLLTKL